MPAGNSQKSRINVLHLFCISGQLLTGWNAWCISQEMLCEKELWIQLLRKKYSVWFYHDGPNFHSKLIKSSEPNSSLSYVQGPWASSVVRIKKKKQLIRALSSHKRDYSQVSPIKLAHTEIWDSILQSYIKDTQSNTWELREERLWVSHGSRCLQFNILYKNMLLCFSNNP